MGKTGGVGGAESSGTAPFLAGVSSIPVDRMRHAVPDFVLGATWAYQATITPVVLL